MSDDISVVDVIAELRRIVEELAIKEAIPNEKKELLVILFEHRYVAGEIGENLYEYFPKGHPFDYLHRNTVKQKSHTGLASPPSDNFFRFFSFFFLYRCAVGDTTSKNFWNEFAFEGSLYLNRYLAALRDTGYLKSLPWETSGDIISAHIDELRLQCALLPPPYQPPVKPEVAEGTSSTLDANAINKLAELIEMVEDLQKENADLRKQNADLHEKNEKNEKNADLLKQNADLHEKNEKNAKLFAGIRALLS
jgi:hypothetical protein